MQCSSRTISPMQSYSLREHVRLQLRTACSCSCRRPALELSDAPFFASLAVSPSQSHNLTASQPRSLAALPSWLSPPADMLTGPCERLDKLQPRRVRSDVRGSVLIVESVCRVAAQPGTRVGETTRPTVESMDACMMSPALCFVTACSGRTIMHGITGYCIDSRRGPRPVACRCD